VVGVVVVRRGRVGVPGEVAQLKNVTATIAVDG
jgi:hypothetical protein